MKAPAIGERCLARPMPNLRVQEHAHIAGRIMPDEWTERVYDDWLHKRFSSGEIMVKPLTSDSTAPAGYVAVVASVLDADRAAHTPDKE